MSYHFLMDFIEKCKKFDFGKIKIIFSLSLFPSRSQSRPRSPSPPPPPSPSWSRPRSRPRPQSWSRSASDAHHNINSHDQQAMRITISICMISRRCLSQYQFARSTSGARYTKKKFSSGPSGIITVVLIEIEKTRPERAPDSLTFTIFN